MTRLYNLLTSFTSVESESELDKPFRDIARKAIYGGHFVINGGTDDEYSIYIHKIEFYYHSEDNKSNIKDYSRYHRNTDKEQLPYFPCGSLHAHRSGIDITFEKENKFRASFLIHDYRVVEKGEWSEFIIDTPSYLGEDLLGYTNFLKSNSIDVKWVDEELPKDYGNLPIQRMPRKNVSLYDNNGNKIDGKFDTREWCFFGDGNTEKRLFLQRK